MSNLSNRKKIFTYFGLVFLLSIPWWILNYFIKSSGLPDNLPITDVGATFMPMLSAIILTKKEKGNLGVNNLLVRIFDYHKIKDITWLIPLLVVFPLLFILTYVIMISIGLIELYSFKISINTLFVFLAFYIASIGEELGYMGYVVDYVQSEINALKASLFIGVFWAIWHIPSMLTIGQNWELMLFGLIATIGFRVIYVWLYNNSNNCLSIVILAHALTNTYRSIFPGGRSTFEKGNGVIGYSIIIIFAVIIVIIYGPKKLMKKRA